MKPISCVLIASLLAGTAYSLPRVVRTVFNHRYSVMYASCGLKHGGFAVVGRADIGNGYTAIGITAYDSLGNVTRSGWLPSPGAGITDNPRSASPTLDGGVAITGWTSDGSPMLIKLDSLGQVQFRKIYPDGKATVQSLAQTPDSGFILAIMIPSPARPQFAYPALLKLDKLGNPVWLQEFKENFTSHWTSIKAMADGGVAAIGTLQLTGREQFGKVLQKFDSLGRTVWQSVISVNDNCTLRDLEPREGGGWLVAGGCGDGDFFGTAGVLEFDENGFRIKGNAYQDETGSPQISALLPMDGAWIAHVDVDEGRGYSPYHKLWKMDSGGSLVWEYPLESWGTLQAPNSPIRQGPGKFVVCPHECRLFEDAD